MAPFWGIKPQEEQPERKKAVAPYVKPPAPGKSERKFYRLDHPTMVLTHEGYVWAEAGDVIEVRDTGIWVNAWEVLKAYGVIIKPIE